MQKTPTEPMNAQDLAAAGQEIYSHQLKAKLEPKFAGKIVAIEVKSGDYFVGDTLNEASQKAEAKYPDSIFYFVRVGFPSVYTLSSVPTISQIRS